VAWLMETATRRRFTSRSPSGDSTESGVAADAEHPPASVGRRMNWFLSGEMQEEFQSIDRDAPEGLSATWPG
jgi:hypothetical protein